MARDEFQHAAGFLRCVYVASARATRPIARMPKKLKMNESIAKYFTRIFENPRTAIPSSSGKGEASMNPPTKNVIHLKKRRLNSR